MVYHWHSFLNMPREYGRPRPHESVSKIREEAKKGNAFFVNRAALNGDLAQLSEYEQRQIVAQANDEAALYAHDQVIPQTEAATAINSNFIAKHLGRAINIIFKRDGRSVKEALLNDDG